MRNSRSLQNNTGLGVILRAGFGFALFGLTLTCFVWAVPAGHYWLDSAELSAAAWSLGVAHPTGFPLFCMIGKAASLIPIGEIAFRLNLVSAFFGAATIWAIYRLGLQWFGEDIPALGGAAAAAILPACGFTFFRQSTVAEIYAPTALFLVIGLSLFTECLRTKKSRPLFFLTLLCGVSIGLHAQLRWLLMLPTVGLLCFRILGGHRAARLGLTFWILGAGIISFIPVRASRAADSAVNWGEPTTAKAVLSHLSAERIRRAFETEILSRDTSVVLRNAGEFSKLTLDQLGPIAACVALFGMFLLLLKRPGIGLMVCWVAVADAIYSIWINPMGIEDLQNGLALHIAVGLMVGAALHFATGLLDRAQAAAALTLLVAIATPAVLADWDDKSTPSRGSTELISAILAQAPSRSSVLTVSDDFNAGLAFARATGDRPDVVALPRQHLWDHKLVADVFRHARIPEPPTTRDPIIRKLAARGELFWEDGDDAPPPLFRMVPDAPLPRLIPSHAPLPPVRNDLIAEVRRICRLTEDRFGRRACSAILVGVGTAFFRVRDAKSAKVFLSAALALKPENVAALTNLGAVIARTEDASAGALLEEQALKIDPFHFGAAMNAGRFRLAAHQVDAARRHFDYAQRLRPQAASPLVGLAQIELQAGRYESSKKLILEALRRDPNHEEAKAVLGKLK